MTKISLAKVNLNTILPDLEEIFLARVKVNLNTILPDLEEIFLGETFPLYSGNQLFYGSSFIQCTYFRSKNLST